MTKAARHFVIFLGLFAGLSACTTDDKTDYCKNHYVYHQQHRDAIASLDITLLDDGIMQSEMQVPRDSLLRFAGTASLDTLSDSDAVFQVNTDTQCAPGESTVDNSGERLVLTYKTVCGAGNRITAVNVTVFDLLPDLDEMLVSVSTTATEKTFAISRQCPNPIFRLR
ncbi:MAG TPA: hypothetical protein PKK10_02900 [Woeseiaceae bacterium]|nr:hypothetical protein [Woeseiaceae bacterium]